MKPEAMLRLKRALRLMRRKRGAAYRRKKRAKRWNPSHIPSQRKIGKKKQCLSFGHWLADTGRQVDYIRGDGNCFFRALSKELYGSEDFHTDWRDAVCDLIESHPCVFSPFVDGGCVSKHLHLMRQLGSWATSCEIYGAATLLRREVYVLAPSHSGQKEYNWLLFRPCSLVCRNKAENGGEGCGHGPNDDDDDDDEDEEGEEEGEGIHPCYITLCLTNGNHYDRIRPLGSGLCNCQLAPPSLNRHTLLMDSTPRRGGRGAQDGGHFHFDWHGAG